jgi:[ribosomal protein S18]-alanine N-acetyltransferase
MTMKLFQRLFRQAESCIDLRTGRVEDLKALGGLLQLEVANAHFFGLSTSREIEGYLTELQSQIETLAKERPVRVSVIAITVDVVPVGYLVLMATPDANVMDLNVMVIDPQWRRRGLARFAVHELVSQLRQGGRRMLVRCLPESKNMMSLLKQLGFKEVPSTDLIVRHFMSPTSAAEGHA